MERNRLVTGFLAGFGGACGVVLALALMLGVAIWCRQPSPPPPIKDQPREQTGPIEPDPMQGLIQKAEQKLQDALKKRDATEKATDAELKKARDILDRLE